MAVTYNYMYIIPVPRKAFLPFNDWTQNSLPTLQYLYSEQPSYPSMTTQNRLPTHQYLYPEQPSYSSMPVPSTAFLFFNDYSEQPSYPSMTVLRTAFLLFNTCTLNILPTLQ